MKNYFGVENIPVIAEGKLVTPFLRKEQYVFCTTITKLRNLAFKVVELNRCFLSLNKDRYRWKGMVLWIYETTLTTKRGATTCYSKSRAAGCRKFSVSEIFNFLERTVEHKASAIRMYIADDSALTTL
jgi:hypothetical protein